MSLFETKNKYLAKEIAKQDYINQMHKIHACLFDYAGYIPATDISKIEITDDSVVMTSREVGIKIICDKSDKRIVPIEILNFDNYEKTDSSMIFKLLKNGFAVFDIGANIGWYSINIAKRFDKTTVFAFEPIPKTFDYLNRNLQLNHITNVMPHNFGFSNKEEDLTFYYYPEGSANASSANLTGQEDVQKISCHVKRLDDFVAEHNVPIDFIKCDVEGAELFVFQGGIRSIAQHKPIIFSEILRKWSAKFAYHPNDIIRLLASLGYKCFTATEKGLVEFLSVDENTVETNFFFLHTVKHARTIGLLT